jgi:hypothetical protein
VRQRRVAALVLPLLLAAACTHRTAPPSARSPASCPSAPTGGFGWPNGMPANLPQPPGARLVGVHELPSGWTLVTFTSPGTVRGNLLFALASLRAAGYAVGRGAAGVTESRLPFTKSGRPGAIRFTAADECATRWQILA